MAVSEKKRAANRANAQKSTGPKTPEGKAISSQNARQPGLCGRILLLSPQDREAYIALGKRYCEDCHPHGVIEEQLVRTLVDNDFQLNRVRFRLEQLAGDFLNAVPADLDRLARYEKRLESSTNKAVSELRRQQTVRRKEDAYNDIIRFEDQIKQPYRPAVHAHIPRLHEIPGFVLSDRDLWKYYDQLGSETPVPPPTAPPTEPPLPDQNEPCAA